MTLNSPRPQDIFLHPGEFHFGSAPGRIGTLLGSCIAVTVWHPLLHCGGMSHILLPGRQRPAGSLPDGRYADEAVELFAYQMKSRRLSPGTFQVRVFGGGDMFSGRLAASLDVGQRNIEATRVALAQHGFTILSEHVGGKQRRRLFLDLSSGHAWVVMPQDAPPQSLSKGAH